MILPQHARRVVEARAGTVPFAVLKRAAEALSRTYREGRGTRDVRLPTGERVAAYLATRMPATYAAAVAVLTEVRDRLDSVPASVLDAGGGAGSAALAARELFPGARITVLETDAALAEAGREILPDAEWRLEDFTHARQEHDLVIAAYALGEVPNPEEAACRLWASARMGLAVIEPGTPRSFTLVRRCRDRLLAAGAYMIAPCPGPVPCPVPANDWCHFAARVERSAVHRRLKDGDLSYEDEKFSYLAVARTPAHAAAGRVVRHPQHQPGLITMEVCQAGGIATVRVPRAQRERFRAARKTAWGDEWNPARTTAG